MLVHKIADQLLNYSGPFELTLHDAAPDWLITQLESTYNVVLPDDFKALYRFSNGFEIDEDMFALIPLSEMIENRKNKGEMWVAEYMIYCDMWGLRINPDNNNDYEIYVLAETEEIVLTNSLAEFIDRALKGAVFEPNGLYALSKEKSRYK